MCDLTSCKKDNLKMKIFLSFVYFCTKDRLWVLVRTPSLRCSNEYLQAVFKNRNKTITIEKWGFREPRLHGHVSIM